MVDVGKLGFGGLVELEREDFGLLGLELGEAEVPPPELIGLDPVAVLMVLL